MWIKLESKACSFFAGYYAPKTAASILITISLLYDRNYISKYRLIPPSILCVRKDKVDFLINNKNKMERKMEFAELD
jgi:hypothetical protein